MSTHCGIAVKTEEGYKTIYCHHDGYESYMYPMLTKNYNTEERATDLVSLGDASSIQERMVPSRESGHSFDNPETGVCIFYHRDRGEDWSHVYPCHYTKDELLSEYYYVYIWEDGKWTAYKNKQLNLSVEKLLD
jgi:hypothetical protein